MNVADLMDRSGVRFGTSGARGLVADMTDEVCFAYTDAFLQYLEDAGLPNAAGTICIGGDYRPSTPRILRAVAAAIRSRGLRVENCGLLPTPALTLRGIARGCPAIMVTGSHIPDDRNGLKFTTQQGEIGKADEEAIRHCSARFPTQHELEEGVLPEVDPAARTAYIERYRSFFAAPFLAGMRVAVYQHSSVAREVLPAILEALGAEVLPLGWSDSFIPVDTEAVRAEDREKALRWAGEHGFDCIISADGDGDRPLVGDEQGRWLRGDLVGVLTARFLGLKGVATPVSSNSAVERCGWFEAVQRTRIGSPYVIEAMDEMLASRPTPAGGYEANGGFLLGSAIHHDGRVLEALPTRDSVIVALAVLALSVRQGVTVSELMEELPSRATASNRVEAVPAERSGERIEFLRDRADGGPFADLSGRLVEQDETDGLRMTFDSGEIVHLRPSGNAPELRCYTEAESETRAEELNAQCMEILRTWRD